MATVEQERIATYVCQLGPAAKRRRRFRRESGMWSACKLPSGEKTSAPGSPYRAAQLADKLETARDEETVKHPAADCIDRATMTEVLAQIFEPASIGN